MSTLTDKIAYLKERIRLAAEYGGRRPQEIILVAVAKKKSAAMINEAHAAGLIDFGENYVQEWQEKAKLLAPLPLRWHFIGHLQTNKVQDVVGRCHLIHSIDSAKLLKTIHAVAQKKDLVQEVLIEIKSAEEPSKTGIAAAELATLLKQACDLECVRVCGLMTVPPLTANPAVTRASYQRVAQLFHAANHLSLYPAPLTILSMGMSHDFEIAITEGSNLVRIGEAIFGPR